MRLLDIIYGLHGTDKGYPYEHIPYSINKLGRVAFSKALMSELSKDENEDLVAWSRKNIVSLFR